MKKFWIGLALGALAGGAVALLFAPQTGASARRKVRRSLEDLGDNLGDAAEYVKEQAERLSKEATRLVAPDKLGDVLEAAQNYAKTAGEYARSAGGKIAGQASRMV